ncbi:MAG: SDR family oxidoreductase [Chloroflexi bacterium]|nr:SDR family oxidoreductase [Chloroflexota bacterium]
MLSTRQTMGMPEGTAQLIPHSSPNAKVVTHQCDGTGEGRVESFGQKRLREMGSIDVVVNNAARQARGQLLDITNDAGQHASNLNVHTPFLMCKPVNPSVSEPHRG